MLTSIINTYRLNVEKYQRQLSAVQRRIYHIGTLRLLLFVVAVVMSIYFRHEGWQVVVLVIIVCLIPFIVLIKVHNRAFQAKDYLEQLLAINRNELAAIDYDISCFDDGSEFKDSAHAFTYDLDIFGKQSVFQYINRTSTFFGRACLADWMIRPLDCKAAIESRQEAVRELTPLLDWRQRFQALGNVYKGKISDGETLLQWVQSGTVFRRNRLLRKLTYLVPAINLILFLGGFFGWWSYNWLAFSFSCFVIANFALQKKISLFQLSYENKLAILSAYTRQIQEIETLNVKSAELVRLRDRLQSGQVKASVAIASLSKQMNTLNQRNNILMSVLLNGFLFWELRQVMCIEAWKERFGQVLPDWLDVIGRMDALSSLGTFAYNHPDYAYPVLTDCPFTLEASQMGHPLIPRNRCVRNDITMTSRPYFIIVTGANMAGKSTYLRTIGVNYVLACIGAPACCERMTLYPAHLMTSLRTTDSLNDNESYFFAELKRLKEIIDRLNAGEELFIILDEILKGTNSVDKQKGSLSLIKQFLSLQANGIIATHDLQLGTLAKLYPDHIRNYCFEATIADNELTFSYKMQPGIARNMNACFLMRKMGIFVDEENEKGSSLAKTR